MTLPVDQYLLGSNVTPDGLPTLNWAMKAAREHTGIKRDRRAADNAEVKRFAAAVFEACGYRDSEILPFFKVVRGNTRASIQTVDHVRKMIDRAKLRWGESIFLAIAEDFAELRCSKAGSA